MPAPTVESLENWRPEQQRRQQARFVSHRGPRPSRKPKEKK